MQMALSNRTAQFLLSAMETEAIQVLTSRLDEEATENGIWCWNYWWFLYCTSILDDVVLVECPFKEIWIFAN